MLTQNLLIWRMLKRDWRGGQLFLIGVAIMVSVAIVSGVTLVADRVERGLVREMGSFLAADLAIASGLAIPAHYFERAAADQLNTAETVEFESMVFSQDSNHLASIKAVSSGYPLRGSLVVASQAFSNDPATRESVRSPPEPGLAWVDERLLPLLDVAIGDLIEVGDIRLRIERVLLHEPDRGTGFSLIGARVLMHKDDLAASGLIQPGSRVDYQLLLAGEENRIREYATWAEQSAGAHERVRYPERVEQQISATVDRGRSYLLLAGSVGLLLAGIAQALASFRYAQRHVAEVALMKSWGASRGQVRRLIVGQLALLALITTALGVLLGWVLHQVLLNALGEFLPLELPPPGPGPYLVAVASGLFCMIGFTLPSLWHLPNISPLRVLRRDMQASPASNVARALWGATTLILLLIFYTADLQLVLGFAAGLALILLVMVGIAYLVIYRLGRRFGHWYGSHWRLAIANLLRRPGHTCLQLMAFACGLMLILLMVLMRTSLLDEWQLTIPPDAPNHFFVNVATHELSSINDRIARAGLEPTTWYPMIRGRLTLRNGEDLREQDGGSGPGRELNLTWLENLPDGNRLVAGEWWSQAATDQALISVEQAFAQELGIQIGDQLTFSLGGLELSARVSSLRSLEWDSMNPNFFVIFQPGVLDDYSPNWISSVFIPSEQRRMVADLLRAHPTVLVISLEDMITRIRSVIDQASSGLEMIFLLVLLCGILVFYAAIASSFDERAQEAAVLRTLGARRKLLLTTTATEFALLGGLAGLLGALAADISIMVLQYWVFELPVRPHGWVWLTAPLGGALVMAVLGTLRTHSLVRTPPMQSLRRLLDS